MQTIYQLEAGGIYAGRSMDVEETAPCPPGWIAADPPPESAGKVAYWRAGWILAAAPAPDLDGTKDAQKAIIDAAYAVATQQPVSFKTAGGVVQSFDADAASQTIVMQAAQGYQIAGSTPPGFYWKAADNTVVPFTLPDLQYLYSTILAQGWAAFQKRTTLKAQIAAATTVEAIQAIVWG